MVFHALDRQTGQPVAVRRFFPFGPDGGGLQDEERMAYEIAAGRLSGLRHPAMRSVVGGGCDPVDGMPFLVTEWVDGRSVGEILDGGPMAPAMAVELLTRVLEVCELLSLVLAEESVWVETQPGSIIDADGRGFTFWISPLRWLGGDDSRRGMDPVVTLAEQVLGWTGRIVSDQAGNGLGGWLRWLKANSTQCSVREAREELAAAVGRAAPKPVTELVQTATRPVQTLPTVKPVSSRAPLIWMGVAVVVVLGAGVMFMKSRMPGKGATVEEIAASVLPPEGMPVREIRETKPASNPERSALSDVERRAIELQRQIAASGEAAAQARAEAEAAVAARDGVYFPEDRELLLEKNGQEVRVEGLLKSVRFSESGLNLYLEFSDTAPFDGTCGFLPGSEATGALEETELQRLVGKRIRLLGAVVKGPGNSKRPHIKVAARSSIEVLD